MPAVWGVWYYCLTGLVCFCFPPPPPLSTSAAINKGTHRPVPTTCVARRGCGALTRHRVPWACLVIVRCEKRLPCCVCTGSSGSHPEPDCLFKAAQMRDYIHDHTRGRGGPCTHAQASPAEGTSVSTPLRLQRKRRVQVKPNICQMLW